MRGYCKQTVKSRPVWNILLQEGQVFCVCGGGAFWGRSGRHAEKRSHLLGGSRLKPEELPKLVMRLLLKSLAEEFTTSLHLLSDVSGTALISR